MLPPQGDGDAGDRGSPGRVIAQSVCLRFRHAPYAVPKVAPCGAFKRRSRPGCEARAQLWRPPPAYGVCYSAPDQTGDLFEDCRGRCPDGDSAGTAQRSHRGDLNDLQAPLSGRPEDRLDHPPVSVLCDEDDSRFPAAYGFRRLVRTDRPLRSRLQPLNIHDGRPYPTKSVYQRR